MKKITYIKLHTGNYIGRYGKYYIFIRIRKYYRYEGFDKYYSWYTAYISLNGKYIASEGVLGSSLSTIEKAKNWVKQKLIYRA